MQTVKDKVNQTCMERYGRKRSSQTHIALDIIEAKNNEELMRDWFFNKKMPVSEIAEILGVSHSQLCIHFSQNLNIDVNYHDLKDVASFFIEPG